MSMSTERLLPPLTSLRLLVPPLRLVAAYLWQVTQRGDAMQYGMLADFVSVVLEAVPDLLSPKHAAELILGLRARVVLELCREDDSVDPDCLRPHLDSIRLLLPVLRQKDSSLSDADSETGFSALVHTLLQDPGVRKRFFQDVFPEVCGSRYDAVLQVLMWDFLRRLEKLLPVPDLLQTVSWLDGSSSLAADCSECVCHPERLKALTQHPDTLSRLDPPSSPTVLGGVIISLLCIGRQGSAPPTGGQTGGTCTTPQHLQSARGQPLRDPMTFEDEVVMETSAVCAQMELGSDTAQEDAGGEDDTGAGVEDGGGESEWGGVEEEEEEEEEEEDMEMIQSSRGKEEEEKGDEVFERKTSSQDLSSEAVQLILRQETHRQGSCIPSCVGEEQAAPTLTAPLGWRRSQRKVEKTWKVKAQEQKVKGQERGHVCSSAVQSNSITSSQRSDVHSCVFDAENGSDSHQQEALVGQAQEEAHTASPQTVPSAGPPLPHSCGACGKSYRFASELKAHQRTHTGERPFACPHCAKTFAHSQALARHRYTHGVPRLYECGRCPEVFPTIEVRNEHRRTAHEPQRDRHRSYTCEQCPAVFPSLSALSRHGLTHGIQPLHRCSCGKAFTHRGALLSHLGTHTGEKPFVCAACGKSLGSRSALEEHRRTHSDDRPFLCPHCGKTFKRQRSLTMHLSVHMRDNAFHCSQCDKSFCYKASLTRHELTHSGERPFLCHDCGKSFLSLSELQKHQRFHTGHKPFRCAVCDKSFTQSCYLTLHMRYHTGARPYACAVCPKSFCSSTRLKRHARIHSGEKPHQCPLCLARFQQTQQLKAHRNKHHADAPDQ